MNVADFDYELPPELVAQYPAPERDASRMLVMCRNTGACELRNFPDLLEYLRPGDCLVLNDTRVIPARVHGHREPSGGRVEAFLLEELDGPVWHSMLRPGRRLHRGDRVVLDAASALGFTVQARRDDGTFEIRFNTAAVAEHLERIGTVPLPPYIQRPAEGADRERYQTVYASKAGAVAAPTAGLHFTRELLEKVRRLGIETVALTLHVGAGTFKPVDVERIEDHVMHEELYELSAAAAAAVNATRARGGRVIAVGTTSVRVLETCADSATGTVSPGHGRTHLFMHPPMRPLVVDGLLTNFHLPRSTLLMLVSTFGSVEHVLAAYRRAIAERLRFYSYGDCMLLIPRF